MHQVFFLLETELLSYTTVFKQIVAKKLCHIYIFAMFIFLIKHLKKTTAIYYKASI